MLTSAVPAGAEAATAESLHVAATAVYAAPELRVGVARVSVPCAEVGGDSLQAPEAGSAFVAATPRAEGVNRCRNRDVTHSKLHGGFKTEDAKVLMLPQGKSEAMIENFGGFGGHQGIPLGLK